MWEVAGGTELIVVLTKILPTLYRIVRLLNHMVIPHLKNFKTFHTVIQSGCISLHSH